MCTEIALFVRFITIQSFLWNTWQNIRLKSKHPICAISATYRSWKQQLWIWWEITKKKGLPQSGSEKVCADKRLAQSGGRQIPIGAWGPENRWAWLVFRVNQGQWYDAWARYSSGEGGGSGMTGINSLWLRQLPRLLQRIKQWNVTGSVVSRGIVSLVTAHTKEMLMIASSCIALKNSQKAFPTRQNLFLRWEPSESCFQRRRIQLSPLKYLIIFGPIGAANKDISERKPDMYTYQNISGAENSNKVTVCKKCGTHLVCTCSAKLKILLSVMHQHRTVTAGN